MRELNVFTQFYQMMGDELENQQRLEIEFGELLPELQLLLRSSMDQRWYNTQRTNEVAAVFRNTTNEISESYVTTCNRKQKLYKTLVLRIPNVEPWIYPLFYEYLVFD